MSTTFQKQQDATRRAVAHVEYEAYNYIAGRLKAHPEKRLSLWPHHGQSIEDTPEIIDPESNCECHVLAIQMEKETGKPMLIVMERYTEEPECSTVMLEDVMVCAPEIADYISERILTSQNGPHDNLLLENVALMAAQVYGVKGWSDRMRQKFPDGGQMEHLDKIIAWAKEFGEMNQGREWDGEWYDEVDAFICGKLGITIPQPGPLVTINPTAS